MGDTTQNWVSDKEEMLDENEIYDEESVKTSPVDLSKKTSEWIPLEEEVDLERDKKIEIFKELHSIDEETAVLLYNAGYTSIDALCAATIKDLTEVNGIKKRKAKKILKEIEKKLLPPIEEETFEEYETEEPEEKIEEYKEPIIEEEETLEQQEKIQIFNDFNSIDEETGTILYNNGYTTIDSLKELTIKTLKDIGVKKRKAKKIFKEIEKKLLPPIEEETFEEYETEEPEEKIEEYKEPIIEEEESIEEEKRETDVSEIKAEGIEDQFKEINSIDDKISNLLLENGIASIQDLNNMTIKELTKIKGIKKKVAKKIKKEINEHLEKIPEDAEKPFISEADFEGGDEWESIPEEELKKGPIFKHREYKLYEKEIFTKSGNKRVQRRNRRGKNNCPTERLYSTKKQKNRCTLSKKEKMIFKKSFNKRIFIGLLFVI